MQRIHPATCLRLWSFIHFSPIGNIQNSRWLVLGMISIQVVLYGLLARYTQHHQPFLNCVIAGKCTTSAWELCSFVPSFSATFLYFDQLEWDLVALSDLHLDSGKLSLLVYLSFCLPHQISHDHLQICGNLSSIIIVATACWAEKLSSTMGTALSKACLR